MSARGHYSTSMNMPFVKNYQAGPADSSAAARIRLTYPLAFASVSSAFLMLVLVGRSNAVNLTDGLDGLAIGLMIIAAGAMTVLSYLSGHAEFAALSGSVAHAGREPS